MMGYVRIGRSWLGPIFAALVIALTLVPAVGRATQEGGPISGVWNSNIGAVYEIWQYGGRFIWWADTLNETAMGRVQGSTIQARWSGNNGDGNGAAVIKEIDGQGRAHRIEWSNGVVFTR